jgi:hypothetical protein
MKNLGKIITIGILIVIVCLAIVGWIALSKETPEGGEGPWGGVDVNVIEKYAIDAGNEPRAPYINTDQGDMLLFVFALGGTVGGFAAGYYWRRLVTEKRQTVE